MSVKKNDDITLTLIFEMFEVINRCIDLNMEHPVVKSIIRNDFAPLVRISRDLSKKYEALIALDSRFKNPNELFETDTDNLYNLILSTKNLSKGWQWKKAIKTIKKLTNESE